jgi:hypothetical protein
MKKLQDFKIGLYLSYQSEFNIFVSVFMFTAIMFVGLSTLIFKVN